MSLFIDKHNRRKSPLALAAFGAALLDLCVFFLMYALLAEPLYHAVALASPAATLAVQGLVIAAAGTALCCLLFLLRDKRVVPWGFAGLGVLLCMFYAAALLLEPSARSGMLWLISVYGLPPVLVGNAVAWSIYAAIRRRGPVPGQRKTLRQELMEAAAREAAKQENRQDRAEPEQPEEPEAPPPPPGPQPGAARSAEEEAMLLYMDDDDEESDD